MSNQQKLAYTLQTLKSIKQNHYHLDNNPAQLYYAYHFLDRLTDIGNYSHYILGAASQITEDYSHDKSQAESYDDDFSTLLGYDFDTLSIFKPSQRNIKEYISILLKFAHELGYSPSARRK